MEYDVTLERSRWIGGSDVPIIMGISTFKTRWQLLLEKAGLKENEFLGNKYTNYGNILEPKIRGYINKKRKKKFEPNKTEKGNCRAHTDGFNGECVLEIKTTSNIYETVGEYEVYLVQLLFYMQMNEVKKGLLAVYERPDDFNTDFEPYRLKTYEIKISDYKEKLNQINTEILRFTADLERLKENPLLTEEDFQPNELVALSNEVVALENMMANYKAIEKEHKRMKQELYDAMKKHDVKSWEMPNGTKITRVDGTEGTITTVTEFDVDKFKDDNEDLYNLYLKTVEKKSAKRSGYVKITLSEGLICTN